MHIRGECLSGPPATGELADATHCLMVFVAVDAQGASAPVRALVPRGEAGRLLEQWALRRAEVRAEIEQAIHDLHDAGCDILTITQYLRPSPLHHPVDRWVKPEEFIHWSAVAETAGFKGVMAGPLVRSSYRAGRRGAQAMGRGGRPMPAHLANLAEAGSAPGRQEAAAVVARSGATVS